MESEYYAVLDELRIVAQVGLAYADDPFDEARYDRILTRVSECYGRSVDLPPETVRSRFAEEVGHVTPKLGSDAAVFDDADRILLQKRVDDGTWGLPGGYVDPNESPQETAIRETREETGLVVTTDELVDVYTRKPGTYGPHGIVIHLYRCSVEDGTLEGSRENEAVDYWALDAVPSWHKNHERLARDALAAHRAE